MNTTTRSNRKHRVTPLECPKRKGKTKMW